ncbi:hypothetical protein D3C81_1286600 [compost metagenome]
MLAFPGAEQHAVIVRGAESTNVGQSHDIPVDHNRSHISTPTWIKRDQCVWGDAVQLDPVQDAEVTGVHAIFPGWTVVSDQEWVTGVIANQQPGWRIADQIGHFDIAVGLHIGTAIMNIRC